MRFITSVRRRISIYDENVLNGNDRECRGKPIIDLSREEKFRKNIKKMTHILL